MSSDAAFSPIAFPSLPGRGADERDSIRGHAAGYAAGRKQAEKETAALHESLRVEAARAAEHARAELRSALDALARAAADLRARQAPVLQSVDASIAAAAIELAEAVVGHELATADGSARAALERASGAELPEGTVVRVSPHDIGLIAAQAGDRPGIELVADDGLQPGDAVVELAHGSIDARVSASLARARAALAEGSS